MNCPGFTNTRSAEERKLVFFLCGRRAGKWLVAFSLLASCIGGTATLAMIALAAQAGWPAFWWLGSGAIGLLILGLFFAARIRETRAATLPEVIALFEDSRCRKLAGIITLISGIAIVAAQFSALGVVIGAFSSLPNTTAIIAGACAITLHTCVGGQNAVMKSDVWQFLLLVFALLLAFFFLLQNSHSLAALSQTRPILVSPKLPIFRIIYFLLIFGSSFIIGPMIFGRILSASSRETAKIATLWASLGLAIMALLITAIGVAISGLPITENTPENLVSAACRLAFPGWVSFFWLIGLLAAIASSADSCLLGAAMIWSNDIRGRATLGETRQAIVIIGAASCLLVFSGRDILGLLLAASDIYTAGIVCPTGLLLATGKKIPPAYFLAAAAVGGSLGLAGALLSAPALSIAGMALSLLISLLGSVRIKTHPANQHKTPRESLRHNSQS